MADCTQCKNSFVTEPFGDLKCRKPNHYIFNGSHYPFHGIVYERGIKKSCGDFEKGGKKQ